jgi:hypothetical protein
MANNYTYTKLDSTTLQMISAGDKSPSITVPAPPSSNPGWVLTAGSQTTSSGGQSITIPGPANTNLTAALNGVGQNINGNPNATGTNCSVTFGQGAVGTSLTITIMGSPGGL